MKLAVTTDVEDDVGDLEAFVGSGNFRFCGTCDIAAYSFNHFVSVNDTFIIFLYI